jgi:beta-barrel assembly-enhancing protease
MQFTESGFFNDGKGSGPIPCKYVLNGEQLYIYLNSKSVDLIIWKLSDIVSCTQEMASFLLSNKDHSTLLGTGQEAFKIAEILKQGQLLREKQQGKLSTRSLYLILGITCLTILTGFLLYQFFLPWAAEKACVWVPVQAEVALGDKLAEIYTSETATNDSVNYFLDKFVRQLKLDSVYPIRVKLIVSEEINAFALPGGSIFIYSALLEKTRSPEEMVALLGHEVSHVSNRHSLKSMSRSMASGILVSLLFGDASGLISRVDQFKQLDYSRELETEADLSGLALMVKNKVNPDGMLNLLQILKSESESAPEIMRYFSTHPEVEARIESVKGNQLSKLHFDQDLELIYTFEKIKSHLKVQS